MGESGLTLKQAAERAGVKPDTLRRWAKTGVVPAPNGEGGWSPAAVAQARLAARLRQRGHSLEAIRRAAEQGRLAQGFIEDLFPTGRATYRYEDVAEEVGIEPALIERLWQALGLPRSALEELSEEDVQALRYVASVLDAGFPLVAFLQIARVYGQALAQIADAETRLFHIYVHEPLMHEGVPASQMAEEMENLARDLLPLASPIMDYLHQRLLQHFMEQDVVGHMEMDLDGSSELGRVTVTIVFADLAGYTRFTEEEGEEEALSYVERFIDGVTHTLPEDARVIKTIGDEVMVVGTDPVSLTDWAVGFQDLWQERPAARIGIHHGHAIYRDGDYFGRDVNLAARVVARARGSEVLVTGQVIDAAGDCGHLEFENIGSVKLKGFSEPMRIGRAYKAG